MFCDAIHFQIDECFCFVWQLGTFALRMAAVGSDSCYFKCPCSSQPMSIQDCCQAHQFFCRDKALAWQLAKAQSNASGAWDASSSQPMQTRLWSSLLGCMHSMATLSSLYSSSSRLRRLRCSVIWRWVLCWFNTPNISTEMMANAVTSDW